ncbi:tyrosine-protein phosphatase [Pseudonocardia sp. McavD-2-B]|uniref:tyrosine-protein phosphatase n=1 Tax=Pseudonocardia sp. McavD-2-B TaxID=2954499 RepID=UPI002096E138|nr:tyrosine-protein phosphatase [Pseudonocardia sp. McavD-2-B]MCO7192139.1 tyrosine-protein phosphatase [Pseudonocardia sp. McavD-2-B]
MTDLVPDRWLTVDGLANARDVGGLPLDGGGRVRTGVLLRTESLEGLGPAAVAYLTDELGVAQVLDLRTDHERTTYGLGALAAAGVPVHRLSFIPETGIALPEVDLGDSHPMLGHYLAYLEGRGECVVDGVRRIATLDSGTTVVHCAAGKDRTGVLVALVCAAVGVPREEITADYALSATRIDALFRKWTTASGEPMPGVDELDRHRPRAEVMAEFLRLLDERHGGPVGWLRENGLTDDELARLRTRLRDGSA